MSTISKGLPWLGRVVILGIAAMALYRLFPVILAEWQGTQPCPAVGPIPACYVVGVGYAAMGVAALVGLTRVGWLFLIGWLPVFLLALSGTTLELAGRPTCPLTPSGTPMCYFSLAIAGLILLPAFFVARRTSSEDA